MLVLPTINGTKAFGFAESRPGHGGVWVRGVVQFAPADAVCVQNLVEKGEPLSYSGPVWHDGRWMTDTFPIELIDVRRRRARARGTGSAAGREQRESGREYHSPTLVGIGAT